MIKGAAIDSTRACIRAPLCSRSSSAKRVALTSIGASTNTLRAVRMTLDRPPRFRGGKRAPRLERASSGVIGGGIAAFLHIKNLERSRWVT
jgi:hypothetical protein